MTQKHAWNMITVFLLLIFGFTAATIVCPKKDFSDRENRTLQTMPKPAWADVISGRFESDYEDYLTDQFPGRDSWITVRTAADRMMLRQDVHDVYFGKDDFLIERHSGVFDRPLADNNISCAASFFNELIKSYDAQHLTCMVVPNAVDIYRDKLPLLAAPYDEEEYLSRLSQALPANVWYDSSMLLRAESELPLYYRTDHHWTSEAAFAVFCDWGKEIGLPIDPLEYEKETVTDSFQGTVSAKVGIEVPDDTIECITRKNAAEYLLTYNQSDDIRSTAFQPQKLDNRSKYDFFYGGNFGLIEGSAKAGSDRKILVIKDSYAHCFVPFLYDYFEQADMIDLRYFTQSLAEWISQKEYTDILLLMNASGFAQDASLTRLLT